MRPQALDGQGTRETHPAADVAVEPMAEHHLPQVLAIEQRAYPKPWSERLFRSELAQSATRRYVVASEGDGTRRLLGYGGVLVQAGEAHITNVAVDPVERRRKIATRLLVELMRGARELAAQAATLEVRTGNTGARNLYERFGFVPVGVRPGYYADTGEDALIMWLHDIDEPSYAERLRGIEAELDHPPVNGHEDS